MQNDKTYLVKCENDGYEFDISEDNAVKGNGCPLCNNRVIIKGINDISTTHPWMLEYFVDKNDAYTNYASSTKRILQKCPFCGEIKESRISNLLYFGFSCGRCSDNISYPNKFMYCLLQSFGISFKREVRFKWCKFQKYDKPTKTTYGIYDFVIDDLKLIIEMDGGLGHGNKPMSTDRHESLTNKETLYIDKEKDKLARLNGYKVIRIDCNYDSILRRFEYIKKSVLESNLNQFFNFSNVDFDKINKIATETNYFVQSYNYWNSGLSTYEIAKRLDLCRVSVRQYLKLATSMDLCVYAGDIDMERKRMWQKSEIRGDVE